MTELYTIIVPDSGPLLTLAAANSLELLTRPGIQVLVPDAREHEQGRGTSGMRQLPSAVRVSNTMRVDFDTGSDALGLWDGATNSIVIRRDQLSSVPNFAGTLLHEVVHARTGYDDVTRDFESALTDVIGKTASAALATSKARPAGVEPGFSLRRLLGR